jgi:predicted cupin superfamily sugar epimerase
MVEPRASELIGLLKLEPHPEGGYYREIWRSGLETVPADGRGTRPALTLIYFLLPAGAVSRWHRVRSDEVWHFCEGAPLELFQLPLETWHLQRITLGPLHAGQFPVHCVPAGVWQAARSLGSHTLVSCAVGPGFDFSDFELMPEDGDAAARVRMHLPEAAGFI